MSIQLLKTSPAAWRGRELFDDPDFEQRLAPKHLADLDRLLQRLQSNDGPYRDLGKSDFDHGSLGSLLTKVADTLENGCGAVRLRGFPVANYSPRLQELLFWGISCHLGLPVSQTAEGDLLFKVQDVGVGDRDPRARGPNTRKALTFHTDRCDVIGFFCIRAARQGGENLLVSAISLFLEMQANHPELLETLQQPFFLKTHNVDTGNRLPYCRQPVFSYRDGVFVANIMRVLIDRGHAMADLPDLTPQQRTALDTLEALAREPRMHVRFRQNPGDMLFVNNFVLFHSREAFEDDPAHKRLLLRVWLSMPHSRPLPEAFRDFYGEIAAGQPRGGIHPPGPRRYIRSALPSS